MSEMKLKLTCRCGGSFEAEHKYESYIKERADRWHEVHRDCYKVEMPENYTIGLDSTDDCTSVVVFKIKDGVSTMVASQIMPPRVTVAKPVQEFTHADQYNAGHEAGMNEATVAMMQLFTDPENQPTQHGTVTVEYMEKEIAAEREACALACEGQGSKHDYLHKNWGDNCAVVIRARGVNG